MNGAKAWKVYGPDLNGRFGGLQGTGGLEAVILDADGTTTGVINDQFGNGVATVSGTGAGASVTWNATRVGAYGPLPGIQAQTLTDVSQVAAATAWRSRRIDPTGFYWLGARYYEPTGGRFLSADPMGQSASSSLYDFVGGDPVNRFDPDGRDQVFMIWTTKTGDVGHTASAVTQYSSDGNGGLQPSGLYVFNEFGPGIRVNQTNFANDVPASTGTNTGKIFSLPMLASNNVGGDQISDYDKNPPDAVIILHTTKEQDDRFTAGLEKFDSSVTDYNGTNLNCTDAQLIGVRSAFGWPLAANEQVGPFTMSTPNAFYNMLMSQFPDARLYVNPDGGVNQSFLDALGLSDSDRRLAESYLNQAYQNQLANQRHCPSSGGQ